MADDPVTSRPPTDKSLEAPEESSSSGLPAEEASRKPGKPRRRRGPTLAELALLRWLAAKPRPVTVGPIGNCVKRGWCAPERAVVEDYDGRRLGFIYVVTDAGLLLLRHAQQSTGAEAASFASGDPSPGSADGFKPEG